MLRCLLFPLFVGSATFAPALVSTVGRTFDIEGATHWTFSQPNRPSHYGSFSSGSGSGTIQSFQLQPSLRPNLPSARPTHRPQPLPGGHPPLTQRPPGSTIVVINNVSYYCVGNRYYWPYVYRGRTYFQPVYPPTYGSGGSRVLYVPPQPTEPQSRPSASDPEAAPRADPGETASSPDLDPRALRLLKSASDYLSGLETFVFETRETVIPSERSSKILNHTRQTLVQRPDKLTSRILQGAESSPEAKGFWFNGKELAYFDFQSRTWSKIPLEGTIDDLIATLRTQYGMNVPMADLLSRNLYTAIAPELTSASVEPRTRQVGDSLCHVLNLENPTAEAALWIDTDPDRPMVRRIRIRYKGFEGLTHASTIERLQPLAGVEASRFDFTPPSDGVEVALIAAD